ncbi:PAS domain-containing sensor histidine kinase [Sulfuricurvum sp.]|uniref:PAS domain-containing sensor histidine kinase n=1 Tax=Sulfuricurvum sp. TaxID=2025608 RepID=UPI002E368076|nr:PAS domain-containing sensor histidine kinase [Sulfuricurvum sp.]HEX5328819.1 PAS domain-containing sensor histidine kinase [Sulfuricurvum sp.]
MNEFVQYTSKSHLFNLIDQTDSRLSFVDNDYIYRAVNYAYVKGFNRPYRDIIGHSVEELLGSETFNTIVKPNLDRALAGEEINYESWFNFNETQRLYMLVRHHPIYNDENQIIGVVVTTTDITEHKLLEEEKEIQNRLFIEQSRMANLGEMVAFLAHQWRRPLHTLSTYLLRMRLKLLEQSSNALDEELERGEEILEHLSQSLESLYHFHSDKAGIVNVKISVEEVRHLLDPHLIMSNIVLDIDLPETIAINTKVPSSQVLHLFSVFIENAIEALEKSDRNDKKIRVCGWENVEEVMIDIRDNGDGVSVEQAHSIFDPGVSSKSDSGHGYGLYFAHKIVTEQLGGLVELIPNEEGAWFRLTFPKINKTVLKIGR